MAEIPVLTGDAKRAVEHRGSHLQIIAAAGSGKTEVVSQRVAALLAEGVPAEGIVAFTFTERAATELKNRIALRVEQTVGADALDRIGPLFVGTIHAYCFRLLQQHVPRYETYDVLDEHQLTAFLAREARRLNIRQLDARNRMFKAIQHFLRGVDVVENELLDPITMPEPFRTVLHDYLGTLDRYRLLSYGQQIARAVEALADPGVAASVHDTLRHLIVDEYQDVNPAQEALIERLAGPGVELCVVGDDDQAIYQWRGSDVANIVTFAERYPEVATYEITTNRRSLPGIIDVANRFAATIPDRLDKQMLSARTAPDTVPRVVAWNAETEQAEAGYIAASILELNDAGVPFPDIAVLVRTSAAYQALMDEFATFAIPVQPGGRLGLFDQPEARALGRATCWLTGIEWRDQYGPSQSVDENTVLDELLRVFALPAERRRSLRATLRKWRDAAADGDRTANLVGEIYELFDALDVRSLDLDDPMQVNRIGTLARFTALFADYESVRRRARPDPEHDGEQVGGERGGSWYYKNLAFFILNHANGAYDGFDGEADFTPTGVDLTTVHRAKGLEWPAVFIPSVTKGRFPSRYTGSRQGWPVPRDRFAADRYEGSDGDERRLFYVALTRARDWVSVSRHERVKKNAVAPSPYYEDLLDHEVPVDDLEYPQIELPDSGADDPVTVTFSELAQFLDCGMEFRLRNLLGFQPRLAPELGYGKAVHHVLRTVAEQTRASGSVPSESELDNILRTSFFLPTANKAAHRQLKEAARRLVTEYSRDHTQDLHRVWETERPFELHLDGVIISGRADVILDQEGGKPASYAILDYKTSAHGDGANTTLQLQVYSDAGRREGLEVAAAYVHDLKLGAGADRDRARTAVDVTPAAIAAAEAKVVEAAERLKARDFEPRPDRTRCRTCEVRTVCRAAAR